MLLLELLLKGMIPFLVVWFVLWRRPQIWKSITQKLEGMNNKRIMPILFLGVVLAEGWIVFYRKLPFVADEVYSLSGASFFAGYDWSSYMSLHKFYNFGYTMLLAPIYSLFQNPVYIYRMMLFVNVILHAVTVLIAYHIMNNKLNYNKVTSLAIALASACSSIILFFKGFVYNELPLAFIVWMMILLLLELTDADKKKRIILSILLALVTAYSYSIHGRCILVFATFAVLCILYLFVYKKWIMQPVFFAVVFSACIYGQKILRNYVQTNLYRVGLDVNMTNSPEQIITSTSRYSVLTSLEGIKKIILNFFSLSGAMTIELGGLLTIVTVVTLYYFFKNFKAYRKGEGDRKIFILMIFSMVSFWGMVACVALLGASNGKERFLVYSRYFTPFIGPFLMFGLWALKENKSLSHRKLAVFSGILTLVVCLIYVFYSYPVLDGTSMKKNASLYFFMPFARYSGQTNFSKNVFAIALVVLIGYTIFQLFLYRRKQFVATCMAAFIFSTALFLGVEERQNRPASMRRYEKCDETYSLLKENLPDEIDVIFCGGTELYRKAVLVSLYDESIEYDVLKIKNEDNAILLADSLEAVEQYNPKYVLQIDKDEWIGLWGEEAYNSLANIYN